VLRAAAACAAAFAAVSVAVALGAFDAVDQWSVDHVMQWLSTDVHPVSVVSALRPVQPWDPTPQVAVDAWLYPASAPISALVLGAVALLLWRRGRRVAAVAWLSAWVLGNAVELLCKNVLERPTLHALGRSLGGFDNSFPSGHTVRSVLLVAALGLLWPRLRPAFAAWLASTLVLLVVASWHTPSDVLGGVLLAGALAAAAASVSRRRAVA
jgi:membrane-associated phospholipid phosphatase